MPFTFASARVMSPRSLPLSRDLVTAAHQQITREWWEKRKLAFDIYASKFVVDEAGAGDPVLARKRLAVLRSIPILPLNETIMELAQELVETGVLPRKAAVDALHIASATGHGCDFLLTWNCRHIANAEIVRAMRVPALERGYELPIICTPEELMGNYDL